MLVRYSLNIDLFRYEVEYSFYRLGICMYSDNVELLACTRMLWPSAVAITSRVTSRSQVVRLSVWTLTFCLDSEYHRQGADWNTTVLKPY
jgi:hypothetical protein